MKTLAIKRLWVMAIVMMKQTMQHVTLMAEIVVETLFTPIFVGIVFALKKKKVFTLVYLINSLCYNHAGSNFSKVNKRSVWPCRLEFFKNQ